MEFLYIALLAAIVYSMYASAHVNSVFKKYAGDYNRRGITAAEAARRVLAANGIYNVAINCIPGNLSDHYDPRGNCINLSQGVYGSTSSVAIGVACHEAGHAVQYAAGYTPVKIRSAIIPVTNLGSKLAFPLILAGAFFARFGDSFFMLVYLGIACFALSTLFQLVTLPTEFDASSRALRGIESMALLDGEEFAHAKQVLRAAAMTYVAALAVSLLQLLRLISMFGKRR